MTKRSENIWLGAVRLGGGGAKVLIFMSTSLRLATNQDLPAILNLHLNGFAEIGAEPASSERYFLSVLATTAIVECDKKLVGYINWEQGAGYGYLCWMVVDPTHRGRGLGERLLDFAIDSCRESGCVGIGLDSRNRYKPAMTLYLKYGFDIIGTFLQTDDEIMIRFRKIF